MQTKIQGQTVNEFYKCILMYFDEIVMQQKTTQEKTSYYYSRR